MNRVPGVLASIYHLIIRAYPPEYHETFGEEIYKTFLEGALEARSQGSLVSFTLRELRDTPRVLAKAYWHGWKRKLQNGIQLLREATSSSDLPPAPPDGRESWRQVGLELSLFLLAGLLLIPATYLPLDGLRAGWQRDLGFLGKFIIPLTLPIFLIGLLQGLPRWAYPFGGLLLGYHVLTANRTELWPFLIAMLLASLILGIAALITNPEPNLFPASVRRIGQSLSLDWTRLSFGFYGAMPLAILVAFDDAHAINRTPYLALSVLVMVACALVYARSRQSTMQTGALVAGMSFPIWTALLDKAAFAGSMGDWITAPYPGTAEIAWMLQLWITWAVILLSPGLLATFNHALQSKRAI